MRKLAYELIFGASLLMGSSSFLLKNYVNEQYKKELIFIGSYGASILGLTISSKKLSDISEEKEKQGKLEAEITN